MTKAELIRHLGASPDDAEVYFVVKGRRFHPSAFSLGDDDVAVVLVSQRQVDAQDREIAAAIAAERRKHVCDFAERVALGRQHAAAKAREDLREQTSEAHRHDKAQPPAD